MNERQCHHPSDRRTIGRSEFLLPRPFEWFCLAAGLFLVLRYVWILDDAFVYFRYADNLLFLKRGLVFNEGEFVEGYTSPFWMLLLIVLRSARLDYWFLTKALAVLFFVLFWALTVRLNRSFSPDGPTVNFPLALLSFAYGPLCYFSSGIETPLVQIAAVLFGLWALDPCSRGLQTLLAISPLVRPEFALPLILCAAWTTWRQRAVPWRMLATSAAIVGLWLGFRVIYYADLLPNTFYLKDDVMVAQGFVYLWDTFGTYRWYIFLPALVVAAWCWRRRPGAGPFRLGERLLLVACALGITAYVVKIGGDPRHYRFLAFPFVLLACAAAGIPEGALSGLPIRSGRWAAPALSLLIAAVAFTSVPRQLDRHPIRPGAKHERVDDINDAAWHRSNPAFSYKSQYRQADDVRRARYRRIAGPGPAKYRICTLCYPAYRAINTRFVNRFGLTDALLARTNAKASRPAHKYVLIDRAEEIAALLSRASRVDAGVYERAIEDGHAPAWVRDNRQSVETIARKIYNRHHLGENLRLAFTFPERISGPDEQEKAARREPGGSRSGSGWERASERR